MPKLNENYLNLKASYLFSEIAHRTAAYKEQNPEEGAKIIRLGIGDVTLPLGKVVIDALHQGVEAMASAETFKGYGPEQGYQETRDAIAAYYKRNGVDVDAGDIFVSDGAKSDTGNITDLFGHDNVVLVPDPVYPVYVDTNIMAGNKVTYMAGNAENGFLPMPNKEQHADVIYLCSPNNPTGACYNKEQLKEWVDYALANEAVILFDSAYEAFITQPDIPHSIFEVEGARTCAIEMCSLSKTAGFTGMRCGYTVIPNELTVTASDGTVVSISQIWGRRQGSKFNGVSYPVQCAAAAVFTEEGRKQIQKNIAYYQENAAIISKTMDELGIPYTGGVNSPYIWFQCPNHMSSWEFFDEMLHKIAVVGTPGEGFGKNGDGWFRLTAFGDRERTKEAMERFKKMLQK